MKSKYAVLSALVFAGSAMAGGGPYPEPAIPSSEVDKSRAEVTAELREAQRLSPLTTGAEDFSAASAGAPAASRCDRPQLTRVEATACAKAAEGITALRHYVQRTRMIHALRMEDFVGAPKQVATAPRGHIEVPQVHVAEPEA